ncbi:MAG: thiamine-phosphate kinase [Sphingobacteriales bacterium]|nr:MAG: thiamine-phosphate kinase [Sphingobacteriales bacterium]
MEETQKQQLTNISTLGEFGLIDRLTKSFKNTQKETLKGVGDDAAVLKFGDQTILISTDTYAEGVHFDMMYTPLAHLGYKCITGSISDIYAMNGTPTQVTVSLSLSSKFTVEALDELYKGMRIACENYGVDLVGGDTTSSHSGLFINVTAIGHAKEQEIAYRNGAKPGDIICVTGDLGGAYIGLQILEREKRVFAETPDVQPDFSGHDYVLRRQLRPEARKDIVEAFKALDIKPTSMIDVSDGLASETLHLCKSSKTGCKIFEEHIPFDPTTYNTALSLNLDATLCALSGGEDYELLFTVTKEDFKKIENAPDFTMIGIMQEMEEGCNLITKSGNSYELIAQGFKHF